MDPVTQGALGAALPQSVAQRAKAPVALISGLLAGMAPDLDVLIRSSEDPLLFLEYHRQFTHSLIFIPLGALLVATALWGLVGRRYSWAFRDVFVFCLLGYATHALLDACTTYGTQLLWPFSDRRFAWNNISIIDPLFTLPLLYGVVRARVKRSPWPVRLALSWCVLYLLLGIVAKDAAEAEGWRQASLRGHEPVLLEAKPSIGNLLLWKVVYRIGDHYHVDAVRLGLSNRFYPGESVAALDRNRDMPWLKEGSQQALDLERFRWFSAGFLALDPANRLRVIDLRYSLLPNEVNALWGIEFDPSQQERHVRYIVSRNPSERDRRRLFAMLRGLPVD
ncbi:MAG: metal-dependent hydrolase [Pseudomonadota bacterium]